MKLLLLILLTPPLISAPIQCSWITCDVINGKMAFCGKVGIGKPEELIKEEAVNRGSGKIFLRECVLGEPYSLKWNEKDGAFFMKGEK